MPIYMDRHDVSGTTADEIANAHEQDLAAQQEHDVRFLAYWFDKETGEAFCLADAPDADSVQCVHAAAHGNMPSRIVEVDLEQVRTFLGATDQPNPDRELLPLGTGYRTMVFTDLKDSTRMSFIVGDVLAYELMNKHDQVIRDETERNSGRVVKHTGDGFLLVFDVVDDALRCSQTIQRRFAELNATEPQMPLRVRIGINPGKPVDRNGDLFGMAVNLAARICDAAKPDQILVAGVVGKLCDDPTLASQMTDAGRMVAKGFESALHVLRLNWDQAAT